MISAFDVYLVMQLDSIGSAFSFLAIVAGMIFAAAIFYWFVTDGIYDEKAAAGKKLAFRAAPVAAFLLVLSALIPSSKTAAAMILVPALTSEEVVEPVAAEAKELYQLAKEALREISKPEKKDDK